jgi:hypothetical protein
MDSEEVVVAEVREEEYQGSDGEGESLGGARRISAGPIITVVLIVIILAGLGLYIFTPPSVNEVIVLPPQDVSEGDDQRYGIGLEIHVTSGVKSYDGTGALDIIYNGQVVHSRSVKITGDKGIEVVNYQDFVMENGVYQIRFSLEGKTTTENYIAKMVPDSLNISVQYRTDLETNEVTTMAVISPEYTYPVDPENPDRIVVGDSIFYYSWKYDLETTFTPPVGEPLVTKKAMWEYHRNKTYTKVWIPIEGEYMGYYQFSAKLVNNLVKDISPYKELTSDPSELVQYLNQDPELGEIAAPSHLRVNQGASFTLRSSDPDTNGRIVYYSIDWNYGAVIDDDENTVSDLQIIEIPEGGSSTVRVTHTYTQTGPYTISITVGDNGLVEYGDIEEPPIVNYQKFDSRIIDVVVTVL